MHLKKKEESMAVKQAVCQAPINARQAKADHAGIQENNARRRKHYS
jgi:hypothetical protein